jgi:UDP-N-acetylmuramoyl-L-alanyl-D-glutamate--2,6-diaminopimelate ligase
MRTIQQLCADIDGARVPHGVGAVAVQHVTDDSREVRPGTLFVAVPGSRDDGRRHAADAIAAGALAVVSESRLDVGRPVVLVPDARAALARIAAEWYGRPADRLRLVGITGTVGKTSVMTMLGEALRASDLPTGTIGSLGITIDGADRGPNDAGAGTALNTTPGALSLQRALAEMADAGTRIAAMEVTSHALVQRRVGGVSFDVGIFTNLTLLEHMEYHGSFRAYARAKARFLELLKPDAPLVYAAGDRAVRQLARRHHGPRVSCGGGGAMVTVRRDDVGPHGTRVTLNVRRPLPLVGGGCIEPLRLPLRLRTLGRPNIMNATLAAVTALCLGARPDAVRTALGRLEPPRRRLEMLRTTGPAVLDDTVGHPDSITAVFELVERIPHEHLRVVFAIRGQRGAEINARDAEALAIWARRVPIDSLNVTSAADTANERNAVSADERSAFLDVLGAEGLEFTHHERLEDALRDGLGDVARDDLVLLLGAQGMDAGAALVERLLPAQPFSRS